MAKAMLVKEEHIEGLQFQRVTRYHHGWGAWWPADRCVSISDLYVLTHSQRET